jgi:hypothetical protein
MSRSLGERSDPQPGRSRTGHSFARPRRRCGLPTDREHPKHPPDPAIATAVQRAAGGNPLFVRELNPPRRKRKGGWTRPGGELALSVPGQHRANPPRTVGDSCRHAPSPWSRPRRLPVSTPRHELLSRVLGQPSAQIREIAIEATTARVLRGSSDQIGWSFRS